MDLTAGVASAEESVVVQPTATTAKEAVTAVVATWPLAPYNIWQTFANPWFAAVDVVKSTTANGKARHPTHAIHVAAINLLVVPLRVSHFVGNGDQVLCCMDSLATYMDNDFARAVATLPTLADVECSTTVAAADVMVVTTADTIPTTADILLVEQDAQLAIPHQQFSQILALQLLNT